MMQSHISAIVDQYRLFLYGWSAKSHRPALPSKWGFYRTQEGRWLPWLLRMTLIQCQQVPCVLIHPSQVEGERDTCIVTMSMQALFNGDTGL